MSGSQTMTEASGAELAEDLTVLDMVLVKQPFDS